MEPFETLKLPDGLATLYPDRPAWLEGRRGVIGGSDIASLLGLSSFTSPLEIYYSKIDNAPAVDNEPSEIMHWGNVLEPVILSEWAKNSGVTYDDRLMIVRSSTFPFLGGSPDAIQTNRDGEPIRWIEIKNVRSDRYWKDTEIGMPERVYAQVQHGMLCSGLTEAVVIALVGGSTMIERTVDADAIYQHGIILTADRWWNDHVRTSTPPAPDGTDSSQRALNRAWVAPQGSVEIPYTLLTEYKAALEAGAECKAEQDRIKQVIEQHMGEAEEATVDGVPVATWKISTRNTIDSSRLRKEVPLLAEKYNKSTTTRTFRVL